MHCLLLPLLPLVHTVVGSSPGVGHQCAFGPRRNLTCHHVILRLPAREYICAVAVVRTRVWVVLVLLRSSLRACSSLVVSQIAGRSVARCSGCCGRGHGVLVAVVVVVSFGGLCEWCVCPACMLEWFGQVQGLPTVCFIATAVTAP